MLSTRPGWGYRRPVRARRWLLVALYVAGVVVSLPLTPHLVRWAIARVGPWLPLVPAAAAVAAAALLLLARLARTRRAGPGPHLALAGIGAALWLTWHLADDSPIGRVHIPEYALLSLLTVRACGDRAEAVLLGGATAAAIGIAEENLQRFVPGRVFDWTDVLVNVSGALLGAAALAWWRWTGGGEGPA
jgi:hypothetical protein